MSLARALGLQEKPHSSITDWVDILTANTVAEEAYDGIPELVDSINLQASGPAEASRAIRKKIKHFPAHQQYRALVLLKALVENCGHKFQTTFADGQLTDALKHLASDPYTDKKVKKKLMLVLLSWHEQFKGDPSMSLVSNLYRQCKLDKPSSPTTAQVDQRAIEREELKRKAKEEKERMRREEEERKLKAKQAKNKPKRAPFDFEKEKPKVLSSIVDASQASSNLVNAITLVNRERESLITNDKVQECLARTKQIRKLIVRYIQLVENEELIGTLIESNERIIAALEMYDQLSTADPEGTSAIAAGLADANLNNGSQSELSKLQDKQRSAVQRAKLNGRSGKERSTEQEDVYQDLQDLNFGNASNNNLPPPMKPSTLSNGAADSDDDAYFERHASLSDYSDYESSDEETHNKTRASKRDYVDVSGSEDEAIGVRGVPASSSSKHHDEDPFADPFAD